MILFSLLAKQFSMNHNLTNLTKERIFKKHAFNSVKSTTLRVLGFVVMLLGVLKSVHKYGNI